MTKTQSEPSGRKVIEQHHILKLDLENSEAFVNDLLNPTPPNVALKAAALRYKKVMCDDAHN
jgi:uncharacterized protein (DUF1778 family)